MTVVTHELCRYKKMLAEEEGVEYEPVDDIT